ncbi:NAD-binding protein [Pseudonocardia bannensis]|uniref:Potassium transporter TrkA n=1 Tax=Pseudonocardia bannensis TaxID=630973 RepID=A0A848DSK6_9PSEU|nr:potassium channel family protein [Pseudonocardia bannensis]NMH95505.1 potassium transporter TrkA [Pseudonocardia bannensis]
MGNPLLVFWMRLFGGEEEPSSRRLRRRIPFASAAQASATIFLILRRMRAPLIVLITIFAISVLGLTLIPGKDPGGQPARMGFFDAFYFMSYTATTIGFGELPNTFTYPQRLWVTITIYLTVIGWAYAIGSLLGLLQDRAFRHALALQHFTRKVARLREPFLLIAGYGQTGELLGRSLDALGRRFVVIDRAAERIDALELDPYHADVPGLAGDAGNSGHLGVAGLGHPYCEGVLALTDDDEVNLAVAMAAALLRPELPVIARTISPAIADRMRAFGTPSVVNPFDCFGDHLSIALRAPATYQLMMWLEDGPGAELPPRGRPPAAGGWVMCGYGRFGRELTADLRAEGLEVCVIEPRSPATGDISVVAGDGFEPGVMARAGIEHAVGFVAGTDNDTTNLSLIAAARRVNPKVFVAARQNKPATAPLFAAMGVDSLLVPTEVIAHEVYAQLSTPLLWRFLQELPARGDEWAARLIDRLTDQCGRHLPALWKVRLTAVEAPALQSWLTAGDARLGDLLRSPEDRELRLEAVPLLVLHGDNCVLAPEDDLVLAPGDEILLAGRSTARRDLETTMVIDATREYVLSGRHVPASWIWRKLARPGSREEPRLAAQEVSRPGHHPWPRRGPHAAGGGRPRGRRRAGGPSGG